MYNLIVLYVDQETEDLYITEIVYDRETGLRRRQSTMLDGVRQSPPDDTPSHIVYDKQGRIKRMNWHRDGQKHRETGPASITINPENGIQTCEVFYLNGKLRNPSLGPCYVRRDEITGEITWQGAEPYEGYSNDYPEP